MILHKLIIPYGTDTLSPNIFSIGLHLGWRYSFAAIGLASLLSLVLLSVMFPRVPNRLDCSLRSLPALFKLPVVTGVYAFTILTVTAHYMAYSYIEPFLKQVAGMTESMTTSALVIFGLSGIIASVLFSKYYGKRPKFFFVFNTNRTCVHINNHEAFRSQHIWLTHSLRLLGINVHGIQPCNRV